MDIRFVTSPDEKETICRAILLSLPAWFGNKASNDQYIKKSRDLPMWVAFENNEALGFIVREDTSEAATEIYVLGVVERAQGSQIGTKLVLALETACRADGRKYLCVKTLDASANYPPYEKTRSFYIKMGFSPLMCESTVWDEDNPCLIMVKCLRLS